MLHGGVASSCRAGEGADGQAGVASKRRSGSSFRASRTMAKSPSNVSRVRALTRSFAFGTGAVVEPLAVDGRTLHISRCRGHPMRCRSSATSMPRPSRPGSGYRADRASGARERGYMQTRCALHSLRVTSGRREDARLRHRPCAAVVAAFVALLDHEVRAGRRRELTAAARRGLAGGMKGRRDRVRRRGPFRLMLRVAGRTETRVRRSVWWREVAGILRENRILLRYYADNREISCRIRTAATIPIASANFTLAREFRAMPSSGADPFGSANDQFRALAPFDIALFPHRLDTTRAVPTTPRETSGAALAGVCGAAFRKNRTCPARRDLADVRGYAERL